MIQVWYDGLNTRTPPPLRAATSSEESSGRERWPSFDLNKMAAEQRSFLHHYRERNHSPARRLNRLIKISILSRGRREAASLLAKLHCCRGVMWIPNPHVYRLRTGLAMKSVLIKTIEFSDDVLPDSPCFDEPITDGIA